MALRILTLAFMILLVVTFVACDLFGDDDDDDDDSGSGGDIEGVPDDVNEFLDPEDLTKLESAGMPIYRGDNPPNIEGLYGLNSLLIIYDEMGMQGATVVYYEMHYYNQTDEGRITQDYEATDVGDSGTGIGAFISGEGDCFTVYIASTGQIEGCDYASPSIHSGCLGDGGISGYHWGLLMTEKSGTNCDMLMPEGSARIIQESDNMASEI